MQTGEVLWFLSYTCFVSTKMLKNNIFNKTLDVCVYIGRMCFGRNNIIIIHICSDPKQKMPVHTRCRGTNCSRVHFPTRVRIISRGVYIGRRMITSGILVMCGETTRGHIVIVIDDVRGENQYAFDRIITLYMIM